jgi:hypothetical protein
MGALSSAMVSQERITVAGIPPPKIVVAEQIALTQEKIIEIEITERE